MSKRKRTSSLASRGSRDESLDRIEASTSSGPTMRKRKKHFDPVEVCHQLYDTIRNHKKSDGSLLCDSFIRVPKRRQEPSYYDVVNNPIDLLKVQQKLKTDEYEDVDDLQNDIELIVNNTKAFYKKNSHEYKDATELWELFLSNKNKILNIEEESKSEPKRFSVPRSQRSTPKTPNNVSRNSVNHNNSSLNDSGVSNNIGGDEEGQYEELFNTVMTAKDEHKKLLNTYFQVLPSKTKYPEYYEVVEQPIDLKRIAIKIQKNEYISILGLERDLMLMCKNACLFNEPASQIYKSAKKLKQIIQEKRVEIIERASKPPPATPPPASKPNDRNKGRRPRSYIATIAAVKDEDEDEEESEPEAAEVIEDDKTSDFVCPEPDNPQWKLFEMVCKMEGSNGTLLSEPFWKLPSRRIYPDYYKEIKNPLSLAQIRRKLTSKSYGTLSEVAGDLTVMFENAKKYNIPSSKLYKDAVKLQKAMQAKVQELLDIDQVTQRVTNKTTRKSSDADSDSPLKRKPCKLKNVSPMGTPLRGRPPKDFVPLKKRLFALCKYMLDYTCEDGRKPILAFMEKPSKKLYSEYYEVIAEPIDFLEIEAKIKADQYSCEKDLVKDFKLMFANCREFNEENSPIYDDANLLEKHLMDKMGPLLNAPEKEVVKKERRDKDHQVKVYRPRKQLTPLERSLKTLFETIRDYKDPKGDRQLSQIFMKLPSRMEYQDYYEVIKHPIDMEKIAHKVKNNIYESVDELAADFVLMLENACKFNEPDSQIYKDALVLQRLVSRTRLQLKEEAEGDSAPDVAAAVQDILLTLFTTVYNHQDEEGRCYSDSMAELPEHDEIDGKKVRALSLDLIKRRLDKSLYKRLDTFQNDFFACLERARRLSRTDSQVFEDSVELQMFFIAQRDELCKSGELLHSPALNYSADDARADVEHVRHGKTLQESLEEETETRSSEDSLLKGSAGTNGNLEETMTCNQKTYQVGDYVYVEAKEPNCEPHILQIERLWEKDGKQMLYGNVYLRPDETYHVTTRKFLEKEVFKSERHSAVPLEDVTGRCCVVGIKQYFTMRPEGYDEKDVYVSESRYNCRGRCFKKIKIFPESSVKLVARDEPLAPKRVMSVFRERLEKHKDELAELQEQERLIEQDLQNVVADISMEIDDGNTYYEQYNTICSGVVKTGDFVYVVADGGRQVVAQIDSVWDTKDGKCYFRGPWFVSPAEVPNPFNKLYYKNELLLSTLDDVNPLVSIVGKCAVLDYNDYISFRPTEVPEQDIFICTSLYDEINRQMKKLPPDGLKKYNHKPDVLEDEIYYFPRLLNPQKVDARRALNAKLRRKLMADDRESSPVTLTKMTDMDVIMEDSLDGGPPSVGSGEIPAVVSMPGSNGGAALTPASTKKPSSKKNNKNKVVTGYILYSREVRKQVVQNNPESKFGDISRIVGSEWKSLATSEKQVWEERASRLNEETKAQLLLEEQNCPSPAPSGGAAPADQVFECLWDNCDYQFEELTDCSEHTIKDSKESQGHVQAYFQERPGEEMYCKWRNCSRIKKNLQPFPNLARLIRHVRDMHINKGNGRSVAPENRSKNFRPSSKVAVVNRPTQSATPNPPACNSFSSAAGGFCTSSASGNSTSVTAATPQKPSEPIFISVPPRPQRVLHSEAYIRYIEGLQADQKHITNWERTLHVTQENVQIPDTEKLQHVATWLGKRADQHDNVVAALWTLRNQLLKDTLCLHKTL
ncbi:protein polybromo-1 isoform X2 [Cylas formicarius]|uniref:protein polybromo-1 isoform X2 n=1 Tax=Cylas formicarius TaxID=197179 RepID=UPI0029589EE0|nr:protein polybromo-1 isoform X2 [Cylas formicarius]